MEVLCTNFVLHLHISIKAYFDGLLASGSVKAVEHRLSSNVRECILCWHVSCYELPPHESSHRPSILETQIHACLPPNLATASELESSFSRTTKLSLCCCTGSNEAA